MRAKFSPTVGVRYAVRDWWLRNGGGYGLLDDGTNMSEEYHDLDHEGYDPFGYDAHGRDRAGHTLREYDADVELFGEVAAEWETRPAGKTPSDYWHAVTAVVERMSARFPHLPVTDPQHGFPPEPGIRRTVGGDGAYGVTLYLEPEAGFERSFAVRFDDGTGGSRRTDPEWTAHVITKVGGETRRFASCLVDDYDTVVADVARAFDAFDPESMLHDVFVVEAGDGTVRLDAVKRRDVGAVPPGDRIGTVYGQDPAAALARYASTLDRGGPLSRMATRGLMALAAKAPSASRPATAVAPEARYEDPALRHAPSMRL